MFESIAFYVFSLLSILSFLIVVNAKNMLYAMSALAAGMMFIAGLFFSLNAEFLGAVQIIVYGGSVVALYAFAMMFFDTSKEILEASKGQINAGILSVGIALLLLFMLCMPIISETHTNVLNLADMTNTQGIGYIIFTKYLIPFEVAALMLLVAMVAGIVLSLKEDAESNNIESAKLDSTKEW